MRLVFFHPSSWFFIFFSSLSIPLRKPRKKNLSRSVFFLPPLLKTTLLLPKPLLARQHHLLGLGKRLEHISILLPDLGPISIIDPHRGLSLPPALTNQLFEALVRAALDGPHGFIRAAESAGVAADVEAVDAFGAPEHVADDARYRRRQRASADEVDAARLRRHVGSRVVHELLRAEAQRQALRLDDGARVVARERPVRGTGLAQRRGAALRVDFEAPGAGADVGHNFRQWEVEAEFGGIAGRAAAERWRAGYDFVKGAPGVGAGGLGELVADLFAGEATVLVA